MYMAIQEIASKFEIKAMPTFVLLSGGVPVEKIVGANPDEIRKRVDHFIHSTRSCNYVDQTMNV